MSSFDVINPNELNSDKLPNGAEIIRHDESAFTNNYKTGKSFDELEETKVAENVEKGVYFAFDFKLHPDGVSKLQAAGNQIQSNCCVLQHRLVMFSFAYAINVVGEDESSGLVCKFRLLPVSHTFRYPTQMSKGGVVSNYRPEAPELTNAKLTIGGVQTLDLVKETDGSYSCDTVVTLESLRVVTGKGVAVLRVEMTVDEDFFDMAQYIDLNLSQAYVAPNSQKILEKILEGEEVPKSDWVITVGDGSPHDFHVHGPVLADASLALRAALSNHMSIGNGILAMVSHEKRFILTSLKSEDMQVLLTFIYHRRYVLPQFDAVSRIGPILTLIFRDEIPNFFKNWEAEIIKNVQKLDKTKYLKTIAECVKALVTVHSSPPGALLAAFNAALTVGADTWQMAEAKGKKVTKEKVKKEVGRDWPLLDGILELIEDFKDSVCGVEKSKYVH